MRRAAPTDTAAYLSQLKQMESPPPTNQTTQPTPSNDRLADPAARWGCVRLAFAARVARGGYIARVIQMISATIRRMPTMVQIRPLFIVRSGLR